MALEVEAHECRNLHEARIDFASSALVAEGDFSDQVMLKRSYRPLNGQLVDFGRVDARLIGPAIKVMLRGCASSPSSAINAMAARTGPQGWQTATT